MRLSALYGLDNDTFQNCGGKIAAINLLIAPEHVLRLSRKFGVLTHTKLSVISSSGTGRSQILNDFVLWIAIHLNFRLSSLHHIYVVIVMTRLKIHFNSKRYILTS